MEKGDEFEELKKQLVRMQIKEQVDNTACPHITQSDKLTDPSQPEKLQEPTEPTDPQCISGSPHAKSMSSVNGQ